MKTCTPDFTEEHVEIFYCLDIDHDTPLSDPDYPEFFDSLWNMPTPIALALEQSCDCDGNLLPFSIRETRLQNATFEIKVAVEDFIRSTPDAIRDYLVLECFWLLRAERAARTGKPTLGN